MVRNGPFYVRTHLINLCACTIHPPSALAAGAGTKERVRGRWVTIEGGLYMDKRRVEVRVNDLVEQVVNNGRIEDDFVECKASLVSDHRKAARQIAALANSARGESAMWIVGLDENNHRVVNASDKDELANWWPAVERCFADLAPDMQVIQVHTRRGSVTVLHFETDRSPYLVTTEGLKGVDREVPWRVGNQTRTATRAQLLSVLIATTDVPDLELIDPVLTFTGTDELRFHATAYFSAAARVVLPAHRWSMSVCADEWPEREALPMKMTMHRHHRESYQRRDLEKVLTNPPPDSEVYESDDPYGVQVRRAGLIINGPDSVSLTAAGTMNENQRRYVADNPYFTANWVFPIDRSDRAVRLHRKFRWSQSRSRDPQWILDDRT